jgi:hypothetical protein
MTFIPITRSPDVFQDHPAGANLPDVFSETGKGSELVRGEIDRHAIECRAPVHQVSGRTGSESATTETPHPARAGLAAGFTGVVRI